MIWERLFYTFFIVAPCALGVRQIVLMDCDINYLGKIYFPVLIVTAYVSIYSFQS